MTKSTLSAQGPERRPVEPGAGRLQTAPKVNTASWWASDPHPLRLKKAALRVRFRGPAPCGRLRPVIVAPGFKTKSAGGASDQSASLGNIRCHRTSRCDCPFCLGIFRRLPGSSAARRSKRRSRTPRWRDRPKLLSMGQSFADPLIVWRVERSGVPMLLVEVDALSCHRG